MARETEDGGVQVQERRGVERAEAVITQSSSPSSATFLRELDSITGPNSAPGSGSRAIAQLDRSGLTGRAETLQANKILDEIKGSVYRHLPFTDNSLTRQDIQDYAKRPNLSDGERALSQRLLKDFNKISTDGDRITSANLTAFDAREKQHGDFRNLYAKDKTGKSLYDSIKDDKNPGGVSGEKLDKRLQDPSLSASDRASLEAVNALREKTLIGRTPYGDVSSGALQRAGEAVGLTAQERMNSAKRAEPRSAEAQAGQAALNDLTARPGGGRSLFDRVTDGQGGISYQKTTEMLKYPERNNLTEQNVATLKYLQGRMDPDGLGAVTNMSKKDLQKLGAETGTNWDRISAKPEITRVDEVTRGRQEDFARLFEKKNGKPSLYERLRNEDGSISSSRIEAELKKTSLNPKDRHTLDYVKGLAQDGLIYGKKDLSAAELVDKARQHNVKDRELTNGGLNPARVAERANSTPVNTDRELPESASKALKVKAGEGYWHAAERLLSEAHKGQRYEPSQKEMKELVNQLREANGNRKELRQNEVLVINQSVRTNPALSGLFR